MLNALTNAAWRLSMRGLERGPHITRYTMYSRLRALGPTLPVRRGRVLSVSNSENLVELLQIEATETVPANYPDRNILALDLPDDSMDFVLSDQVLEHVEGDPQQAVNECHRVLKPGGIAVHTTCFINPFHAVPKDFWRFTPDALSLLHKDWSETLEVDGWGNLDVWDAVRRGFRYEGVPYAKWHPLHKLATRNDPEWHIVVWIAARK
jgi:SAM-dependent methyltransferase